MGASNLPSVDMAAEWGAMSYDEEDNLLGLKQLGYCLRGSRCGGRETREDGSHLSCTVDFTSDEEVQGGTYRDTWQWMADLKEEQIKLMCHGMGALVAGGGEEAKTERGGWSGCSLLDLCCEEKTKRERGFSR